MKKMTITLSLLLFILSLYSLSFAKDNFQITIVASIKNISDVKLYVAEDTVLQLIKIGKDGQLKGGSDSQGRIFYKSDLAKIQFPKKAVFEIFAKDLKPGTYLIAGQFLNSISVNPLLIKAGKYAMVEVPKDLISSKTIDLGEVSFQIR